MTGLPDFAHIPNPAPQPAEARERVLAEPGFGQFFTDNMVTIDYSPKQGWHNAVVRPYGPIQFDPASTVLHYGQAIFEGLKAYRHADGSINSFRPDANARRFQLSAERIAMAELPEELFLESLRQLLSVDKDWVPNAGGEASLYLRPFLLATDVGLGVRPSDSSMLAANSRAVRTHTSAGTDVMSACHAGV